MMLAMDYAGAGWIVAAGMELSLPYAYSMTTHPVSKSTQTGISCHSASTSMSSRTGETAMCLLIAIVAVLFYHQYACNFLQLELVQ